MTCRNEQVQLFNQVILGLEKEEEELRECFDVARNLACSEWSNDFTGRFSPTNLVPKSTELLRKNFDRLMDIISRKRYYAIVLFWEPRLKSGALLTEKQMACFGYWEEKLGLLAKKNKTKQASK